LSPTASPASRQWRVRQPRCSRSPRPRRSSRSRSRTCIRTRPSVPPPTRSLEVAGVEPVGAYTLVRLRDDGGDNGVPGQFFMLRAEPAPADAYLPRAVSAAWAGDGEIAFLLDVRGPGTRALAEARTVSVLGPLGHGFTL